VSIAESVEPGSAARAPDLALPPACILAGAPSSVRTPGRTPSGTARSWRMALCHPLGGVGPDVREAG